MFGFYIRKNEDPVGHPGINGKTKLPRFRFPLQIGRRPGLESKADAAQLDHTTKRVGYLEKWKVGTRYRLERLENQNKFVKAHAMLCASILSGMLEENPSCFSQSAFFLERLREMDPGWSSRVALASAAEPRPS